jgi:hypothetical protein
MKTEPSLDTLPASHRIPIAVLLYKPLKSLWDVPQLKRILEWLENLKRKYLLKIKAMVFERGERRKDLKPAFDTTKEDSKEEQEKEPDAVSPIEGALNGMGHIEKGVTGQIQNNIIAQTVVSSQI